MKVLCILQYGGAMKIGICTNRPVLEPCTLENLDYQIDPYVGCEHYCYYCYALKEAETDWTQEVRIHRDLSAQLAEELDNIPSKICNNSIYMGYNSDPYQPCEESQKQTRLILQMLLERGYSARILTKSSLFTRDIDLLSKMENAGISISVAFTENNVRELFEYKTINTEERINALAKAREAGISTSALLCPVIPYITEVKTLINRLAPLTDRIWIYRISFTNRNDLNWQNMEKILSENYASRKDKIEEIVFSKEHTYWKELRENLELLGKEKKIDLRIHL